MYHFLGYVIKNEFGDVVQYVKTKAEAESICTQNGLPTAQVSQVFEYVKLEYKEPADIDTTLIDS